MGLLIRMVVFPIIDTSTRHRTIVWGLRIAAIPLAIILFVVLIRNFYTSDPYAGKCSFSPLNECSTKAPDCNCKLVLGVAIFRVSLPIQTTIAKGMSSKNIRRLLANPVMLFLVELVSVKFQSQDEAISEFHPGFTTTGGASI